MSAKFVVLCQWCGTPYRAVEESPEQIVFVPHDPEQCRDHLYLKMVQFEKDRECLLRELQAAREVVEVARAVAVDEYDVYPADVRRLGEAIRRYDELRGGSTS